MLHGSVAFFQSLLSLDINLHVEYFILINISLFEATGWTQKRY